MLPQHVQKRSHLHFYGIFFRIFIKNVDLLLTLNDKIALISSQNLLFAHRFLVTKNVMMGE